MTLQKTIGYRIAVMLVCISITAYTLSRFALLVQTLLSVSYHWQFELTLVCGQLIFQFPFIYQKPAAVKMVYYENMLMVSLIGSGLLIPILLVNQFYALSILVNIGYFFTVVGIMFLEHYRRVRQLNMPAYLCWTWVLYRLIVLLIIL